jgi:hypothetical protein
MKEINFALQSISMPLCFGESEERGKPALELQQLHRLAPQQQQLLPNSLRAPYLI